jgi:hypothetical protein
MMPALRIVQGLIFECPSPSIWQLVGGPVMIAYDGKVWKVSMVDRDGAFREGQYASRDLALAVITKAFKRNVL